MPKSISPLVPDVDDQHHFLLLVGCLGNQHGDIIRADKTCLHRQAVDISPRGNFDPQIPGLDVHGLADARGEGGPGP